MLVQQVLDWYKCSRYGFEFACRFRVYYEDAETFERVEVVASVGTKVDQILLRFDEREYFVAPRRFIPEAMVPILDKLGICWRRDGSPDLKIQQNARNCAIVILALRKRRQALARFDSQLVKHIAWLVQIENGIYATIIF